MVHESTVRTRTVERVLRVVVDKVKTCVDVEEIACLELDVLNTGLLLQCV